SSPPGWRTGSRTHSTSSRRRRSPSASESRAREPVVEQARRAPARPQALGIPAGGHGSRLVGALEELEQRLAWVARRAHLLVGEEREVARAERLLPARGVRPKRLVREAFRLGSGVRVEGRLAHLLIARPG